MSDKPDTSTTESADNNLPKAYDPSTIEQRWADYWIRERLFDVPTPTTEPGAPSKLRLGGIEPPESGGMGKKTFSLLLPPPNVTGRLHMGHMFEQTEMDILTRWHRMRGETALWVPGTDHAGIATQLMVERQLATEGANRKTLGREAFTARVWEWKHQYGSAITDQMRRLGASVDWSREYFTMDDRLNIAVREAFVRLYEQELIYRGAYIVNWDPVLQTAVSDLEVDSEERIGKLYSIRYPLDGAQGPYDETNSIVIATTRPETMLGDVAVAVNPKDERYKHLVGTMLQLPLTQRKIPIIADDWANPEFGTGAVKVTPAHDPNDFAIGQRHPEIGSLTIFDETAHIKVPGGSLFEGLDRFEARKKIVEELRSIELLVEEKDHPMTLPISQRSGTVVEPRLSMQWFLAVNKPVPDPKTGAMRPSIAQTAIDAVEPRNGSEPSIRFNPEMYKKVYLEWMNNIHDWCISRQLWWGHRIPAWYCDNCKTMVVARVQPSHCANCSYSGFTQDADVLDTWFSSGLLPFTVFGWNGSNELTPDLAAFYPTKLLVTGFDILFFWVARMIMLSTHFMYDVPANDGGQRKLSETVPFENVHIHALVRDANREKMSKTKGNVIDPIEIIERFGTDAVRFTLASMASPGTDIAFSEARTEGNRAFANKIWNAARFLFMNLARAREANIEVPLPSATNPGTPSSTNPGAPSMTVPSSWVGLTTSDAIESRWILARLSQTAAAVNASLAAYRFDEAASHIYQFFWGDLCDWYLEIVKLRLNFSTETIPTSDDAEASAAETRAALTTLVAVFESALRLLSPFMPFLTEEIWHALYAGLPPAKSIALTRYPQPADYACDTAAIAEMQTLQELITTIRALRKELGVPEKESAPIRIHGDARTLDPLEFSQDILARLARVSSIHVSAEALTGANARSTASFDVAVVYEKQIDVPAERERLTKDLAKLNKQIDANQARLADEKFTAKAPAQIVEGLRKQTADLITLRDKAQSALDALPSS